MGNVGNIFELKEMELHEKRDINNYLSVIRVYGGWIYMHYDNLSDSFQRDITLIATTFVCDNKK